MSTVLIVDDDPVSRVLLRHVVARSGHQVVEAEDAHAALRRVTTDHPALIISDHEMPGMSGLELRAALGPSVPFVLVTGYAAGDDFAVPESLGVDAVLTKPAASADVEAVLRRFLG